LTDVIEAHGHIPYVYLSVHFRRYQRGMQAAWTIRRRHGNGKGYIRKALVAPFMTPPPIVVFDLDGTLADTAQDLIATLNVILVREGVPPLPFEQARDLIGAGARPLIQRGFATSNAPLTDDRLQELYAFFLDYYHHNIAVHSVLFPGVLAAMERLAADGFLLAVCTNKLEAHALELLKVLEVLDKFAFVSGKDSFDFFKPDPRHLTETIRRAAGDPQRAVMIGDSKTDIDTAKNAGIPVVGVTFGYTDVHVRDLGADAVIDHFDDLNRAVHRLLT
jgi:phosphoglycolate phosphatase